MTGGKKGILFLCVANSARSQLAEALAREKFGENFRIQSAGSSPSRVNPYALKVLQEKGISIEGLFSKKVDDIDPETVDIVITLCKEEVCPVFPTKVRVISWAMEDPVSLDPNISESSQLDIFRATRDKIQARLDDDETIGIFKS